MFYKRQNLDAVQLVTYRQTDRWHSLPLPVLQIKKLEAAHHKFQ